MNLDNIGVKIGAAILLLGISFAYGRYSAPKSTEIKEITKEVVKTEKEYVIRDIKKPDGTTVHEVVEVNKTEQSKVESSDTKVTVKKPDYKVSIIPQYSFDTNKITYGGSVEKRISGPIFVGIYADSDKRIGLSVGVEF